MRSSSVRALPRLGVGLRVSSATVRSEGPHLVPLSAPRWPVQFVNLGEWGRLRGTTSKSVPNNHNIVNDLTVEYGRHPRRPRRTTVLLDSGRRTRAP